jgi:hypothetical protein
VIIGFAPFTSGDTGLQQPSYQSLLSENSSSPTM